MGDLLTFVKGATWFGFTVLMLVGGAVGLLAVSTAAGWRALFAGAAGTACLLLGLLSIYGMGAQWEKD